MEQPEVVVIEAAVGTTLSVELAPLLGEARRFRSRGGPQGLSVRPDGLLEYELDEVSAGRWGIEIRMGSFPAVRRRYVELQVSADGRPLPEGELVMAPVLDPGDIPVHLGLGLGVSGAGRWTPGSVWVTPGSPALATGLSPAFHLQTGMGGNIRATLGLELTPLLYVSHRHYRGLAHLGMDFRPREPVRVGLFLVVTPEAWLDGFAAWLFSQSLQEPLAQMGGGGMISVQAARHHDLQLRLGYHGPVGARAGLSWCWTWENRPRDRSPWR